MTVLSIRQLQVKRRPFARLGFSPQRCAQNLSGVPRDVEAQSHARLAMGLPAHERREELFEALYLRVDAVRTSGGEFTAGVLLGWFRNRFPLRFLAASDAKARLDARTERNIASPCSGMCST